MNCNIFGFLFVQVELVIVVNVNGNLIYNYLIIKLNTHVSKFGSHLKLIFR